MTWTRSDMSRRSSWTKADIRQARQTQLKPVLEQLGYRLQPRPAGNYAVTGMANEIVIKDHYPALRSLVRRMGGTVRTPAKPATP